MIRRITILCLSVVLAVAFLTACKKNTTQFDLKAPVPMDPNVRMGVLDNGLTYYVRHNAEPKERASFYIIQNVGAILENDDQNGLAHFLEHMAFNGSKNFPGRKGIVNTLEKYGVEFGRNINAYTAQDETVYNISNVPTTFPNLLDTCLLVLHDWSHFLDLEGDEIDQERGVISEEYRTRRNASARIREQIMPVLLNDSKYSKRDVIGSLDIINNHSYQTLRDYYHKWYRPDLQAIAVAGDFDIDEMEQKIKDLFSQIPTPVNPAPRETFDVPYHKDIKYVLATDKEVTSSSISWYMKYEATPYDEKNHEYLREQFVKTFYQGMLSQRISEMLQKGNPPFINGSSGFTGLVRGYEAYVMSATAKPNEEAQALEAIYRENVRVQKYGFTEGELERVKKNTISSLESALKQVDKTTSDAHIKGMQGHFLYNSPNPSFEYYYDFAKEIIPTITIEEVSALANQYIQRENSVIVVQGPSEGVAHITREEALAVIDKVDKSTIEPYVDNAVEASLINKVLTGSPIINTENLPQFDAEKWTLENGVEVLFRKADYEKDQVSISSYSKGGTSLYDIDKLASASVASSFIGAYGLGDYDATTLGKLLTGKKVNVGPQIGNLSESINGASTPEDFETLMQLIYLFFEEPRFDKEAHDALMERNYAAIAMQANNPGKIMQDSVNRIMSNYSKRNLIMDKEFLDAISIEQIEEIYRDRFNDISDFTFFIVGNIDADVVKPLVEKYLGSIPAYNRNEEWVDHKIRLPKGRTEKVIELALETPKSVVITHFTKEMKNTEERTRYTSLLKNILDLRYTENIREKEGGTYGVQVAAQSTREPYESYSFTMQFDCDPDKATHLKSLIYADIKKIMENGPTKEELEISVNAQHKNREQSKEHNAFWMNAISTFYLTGVDITDEKNYEELWNKVKPEDIKKFANEMFKGADEVDITFKPKGM